MRERRLELATRDSRAQHVLCEERRERFVRMLEPEVREARQPFGVQLDARLPAALFQPSKVRLPIFCKCSAPARAGIADGRERGDGADTLGPVGLLMKVDWAASITGPMPTIAAIG
jgi:hypothetical protein